MMEFVKEFNLTLFKPDLNIGFWNNNEFKIILSNNIIINLIKFIYNYGISLFTLKNKISKNLI